MKPPVPASELLKWIPHRPPMVWIDEVTEIDKDGGSAVLKLKPDSLYLFGGKLESIWAIEIICQAFAFVSIAQVGMGFRPEQKPLKEAFLVGVRNIEISPCHLAAGETVKAKVEVKKELPPLILFHGEAQSSTGDTFLQGQFKVFARY